MGLLDSFERGLERAVNGAFARTFRSGVQPVEIAAALRRELDVQSIIVDRDRVITSNEFQIQVSPDDAQKLSSQGESVISELTQIANQYAKNQNYQFLGPLSIVIVANPSTPTGVLEIKANKPNAKSTWTHAIVVNGKVHPLRAARTVIGRGSDCDIQISDGAASRAHLEILVTQKQIIARDLNSTNGTKYNGERFRELILSANMELSIGQTSLTYQLVPQINQNSGGNK